MASLTFGSLGDIVTVCGLVFQTVQALSDSTGSSAQYQELLREVRSLNSALQSVSRVIEEDHQVQGSEELRDALSNCYTCLNSYLKRITKYHESLKKGGSKNVVKDRIRKLQWQGRRDDVARFRAEISIHVSSISAILSTYHIRASRQNQDAMKLYMESKFTDFAAIEGNRNLLLQMDATMQRQKNKQDNSFERIFQALSKVSSETHTSSVNEFQSLIDQLRTMIEQQKIPQKLERTWTQEPAILDDAFGRVFPIHLEFINSWESFLFVLSGHFKNTPGEAKIPRKEFLLHSCTGRCIDFERSWWTAFRPGERVSMGMLFVRKRVSRSSCPLCQADNDDPTDSEVQCKECHIMYRRILDLEDCPLRGSSKTHSWSLQENVTIVDRLDNNVLNEDEVEPTEELHAYKRLVLRANEDNASDVVSQRAIENLINYGLARSREEATAMLLAKYGHLATAEQLSEVPGTKAGKGESSPRSPANDALIRMNETDKHLRQDMQEIVSLTGSVSGALRAKYLSSGASGPSKERLREAASSLRLAIEESCLPYISNSRPNSFVLGDSPPTDPLTSLPQAGSNPFKGLRRGNPPKPSTDELIGPDRRLWYYGVVKGEVLGPYTGFVMNQTYRAGIFHPQTKIRTKYSDFETLNELEKRLGTSDPFLKFHHIPTQPKRISSTHSNGEDPYRALNRAEPNSNRILPYKGRTLEQLGKESDRDDELDMESRGRAVTSRTLDDLNDLVGSIYIPSVTAFTKNPPQDRDERARLYRKLHSAISTNILIEASNLNTHQDSKMKTRQQSLVNLCYSLLHELNTVYGESHFNDLAQISLQELQDLVFLVESLTSTFDRIDEIEEYELLDEKEAALLGQARPALEPGTKFFEVMTGYIHTSHREEAGLLLSAHAYDADAFFSGDLYQVFLTGTFTSGALPASPYTITGSSYQVGDGDERVPVSQLRQYKFDMVGTDGSTLHFHGEKALSDLVAFSMEGTRKTATTLSVSLTNDQTNSVGYGKLQIHPLDLTSRCSTEAQRLTKLIRLRQKIVSEVMDRFKQKQYWNDFEPAGKNALLQKAEALRNNIDLGHAEAFEGIISAVGWTESTKQILGGLGKSFWPTKLASAPKYSDNNPKLIAALQDSIKRLVIPELDALKAEQKRRREYGNSVSSSEDGEYSKRGSKGSHREDSLEKKSRCHLEKYKLSPSETSFEREKSQETIVHDRGRKQRKQSKESSHLKDAIAEVITGRLTYAALKHHDSSSNG